MNQIEYHLKILPHQLVDLFAGAFLILDYISGYANPW